MPDTANRIYFNSPRFFEPDFYDSAKAIFIERYANHKDVLSIYNFGQVSVPGISDLDFLVVMKDSLSEPLGNNYSVASFDEDLRYIYNDTQPFVVPEGIYEEFWKIFPANHLSRIFGRDFPQKMSDNLEARRYKLLVLIEVCHYFYPVIFLNQLHSAQINVRFCLLILNALRFPLNILMELCEVTVEPWVRFMKRVASLREHWFQWDNDDRHRQLNVLLLEAAAVSIDLIDKLNRFIEADLWRHAAPQNHQIAEGIRLGDKVFVTEFNPEKVLEDTRQEYKQSGKWRAYLPLTFIYPLLIYRAEQGRVSAHLKKLMADVSTEFVVKDEGLTALMQDRIRLMNKHGAFYADNAIKINMVHSYYGFNPKPGSGKFYQLAMRPHRFLHNFIKNWRKGR
ncbi:MAG: hypothetical protein QNJ58_20245 [Desulfobacterales bacterium]|nr:hypothetical protein [Desulfobacterales bacterium]